MAAGWLPALVIWTQAVAVRPALTVPNLTEVGDAVNLLTGGRPVPDRVTLALAPVLPAIVSEEVEEAACIGPKATWTGTASPGWMMDPGLGSPRAANGGAGPWTVVTFSGDVPPLTMSTVWRTEM